MPSSYSSSLRLELMASGEKSGQWGDITNTNLRDILEASIAGQATISMTDGDYSLSALNGTADEARNAIIKVTSIVPLTATRNIIVPSVSKTYTINNSTSNNKSIVIKTQAGTGVAVLPNTVTKVICDGTNILLAHNSSFLQPQQFGAKGDGLSDDTTSITATITAAANSEILFPQGIYKLTNPYTAPNGTKFRLKDGASFTTNQPNNVSIFYETGRLTNIPGSKMGIGYLYENSQFKLEDAGSTWFEGIYTYFGISKEFTNNTAIGQANTTPSSSLFVYSNNNGSNGNITAIIGNSVARTSNAAVLGENLLIQNDVNVNGAKLTGLTIDILPQTGTKISTLSKGIEFNIYNIASNASVGSINSDGIGSWQDGFVSSGIRGTHYGIQANDLTKSVSFIDTTNGNFSTAAIKLGNTSTQGISFGGSANNISPFISGETTANLNIQMGTSGIINIKDSLYANKFVFTSAGNLNLANTTAFLNINSTQVVGARQTGWVAMTGIANTNTVYDTSTITLAQLAQRVKSLQDALTTHGLIGT